jgi:hypothetical protein
MDLEAFQLRKKDSLYEAIRDAWCGSGTASIGARTKKLKTLFDRARDLLRRFASYRILPVRRGK